MSPQAEIDVHEELAGAAITPLHKTLGVLITLITLFDGYDTFNPAYVIHYVMKPWGLLPSQAGLLVSSGLVGFLFGAMGHGMAADRLGRRITLLAGLWIVNVLTLLTAMFLHGGIGHILGNMWFLWIFGPTMEARFGRLGFASLYVIGGIAANIVHLATHPESLEPVLGAVEVRADFAQHLDAREVLVLGLDERGDPDYMDYDFKTDCVLVLGREGAGLHDLVKKTCDHLLRIPMAGQVSSLNVSVAGAVVMYEAMRQRRQPKEKAVQKPAKPRKGLGS